MLSLVAFAAEQAGTPASLEAFVDVAAVVIEAGACTALAWLTTTAPESDASAILTTTLKRVDQALYIAALALVEGRVSSAQSVATIELARTVVASAPADSRSDARQSISRMLRILHVAKEPSQVALAAIARLLIDITDEHVRSSLKRS